MSKGLGQKIAIQFTEELRGDVTGLFPAPFNSEYRQVDGMPSASSQYSSFGPDRAFDGSTSSYWYTRTTGTQWIQAEHRYGLRSQGFRWYVNSYRPKTVIVEASNDGFVWDTLLEESSPDEAGWHEFQWEMTEPYYFYRWSVTDRYSSYLYIYAIELFVPVGNERAFTISGQEYQHVNGPIIPVEYKVISVERHPNFSDDKHLLLTLHPQGRFNNVEGTITVNYDQSAGSLRGRGGPVPGFSAVFLPTELEPKPNPSVSEHITVTADADVSFVGIAYKHRYTSESLVVEASASVDFVYVGVVNP